METTGPKDGDEQLISSGWRTRPIFVSGTFRDMHVERDALADRAFLALRDALLPLRTIIEWIDLRVGVETKDLQGEHPKQMLVLQVCLEEVRRSRPFLVVLLGDRYGWVPPRERMDRAVEEAGYRTNTAGKSVTGLEVEFGVWGDPEQRTRSFFYFRKLPYDAMDEESKAEYSDKHAADAAWLKPEKRAAAKEGWPRLQALKARLQSDPATAARCRTYPVGWDPVKHKVTGVNEALVPLVIADLWKALEEEALKHLEKVRAGGLPSELEQFVAVRAARFVGRKCLIDRLAAAAVSPAEVKVRGVCLTGASGAGKSAVFARLHEKLSASKEIVLLSHAAGISPASERVDAMLGDWIARLAAKAKVPNPLDAGMVETPTLAGQRPRWREEIFADLLHRVAGERRVVILIDALDRFERTNRGRYLTWLPRAWPANLRFIATTIAGDESEVLDKRSDTRVEELRALDHDEAELLAESVYARYHREPNREAVDTLLDKKVKGRPAAGNPLWLVSAVEELNLLDRVDFLRADREFKKLPTDAQLPALVLALAKNETPADLSGLLAKTLERSERAYGVALTRAFTILLVLGRIGWRERDLAALVPTVVPLLFPSGTPPDWQGFSPLAFAALRRGFRGHVVRRGQDDRWDFFHLKMRTAAGTVLSGHPDLFKRLHAAIAGHLLGLSPDDPLRESETMYHLIQADDRLRAADIYAGPLTEGALAGSTDALADYLLSPGSPSDTGQRVAAGPRLDWTCRLVFETPPELEARSLIVQRYLHRLVPALRGHGSLEIEFGLASACAEALQTAGPPFATMSAEAAGVWEHERFVAAQMAADACEAMGRTAETERWLKEALGIARSLHERNEGNQLWCHDLVMALAGIGKYLHDTNNCSASVEVYRRALDLTDGLTDEPPESDVWQLDRAALALRLGEILVPVDAANAREAFREGLQVLACLARRPDASPDIRGEYAKALGAVGGLEARAEWCDEAKSHLETALERIESLLAEDPKHREWLRTKAVTLSVQGDVLEQQGRKQEAAERQDGSILLLEALVAQDPGNAAYAHDLAVSCDRAGDLCLRRDQFPEAQALYQRALQVLSGKRETGEATQTNDPETVMLLKKLRLVKEKLSS
jgi:hypothetical protein